MHSKWVLPALPLYLSVAFAWSQPACHADWRDSLIRALAPRLVDKTFDYLLRNRARHTALPAPAGAPQWTSGTDTAAAQPATRTSAVKKTLGGPASTGSKASVSVPPPPNTLLPPPPPGVPTGAVLGLYPQQMNNDPQALSASLKPLHKSDPPPPRIVLDKTPPIQPDRNPEPLMPKPAPDFRRYQRR